MIFKVVKWVVIGGVGLALAGGFIFGKDLFSYVRSGAKSVRSAVRDSLTTPEFELARARDLLEDIIPEMQANIRLIAEQEVEIANLKADIDRSRTALAEQAMRIQKLRDCLGTSQVRFMFGGLSYTRDQLKEDLARRFDTYKEAELVLAGKQRLLESREKSLVAAIQAVERTRLQKANLENQIAALEAKFRLIQASANTGGVAVASSKVAQTEKVIAQIRKQLDVAERVLAHEARFTESIPVDVINEKDLLEAVDEHFQGERAQPTAETEKPTGPAALGRNPASQG